MPSLSFEKSSLMKRDGKLMKRYLPLTSEDEKANGRLVFLSTPKK
jgi:hypothetical protein